MSVTSCRPQQSSQSYVGRRPAQESATLATPHSGTASGVSSSYSATRNIPTTAVNITVFQEVTTSSSKQISNIWQKPTATIIGVEGNKWAVGGRLAKHLKSSLTDEFKFLEIAARGKKKKQISNGTVFFPTLIKVILEPDR